MSSKLAPKHKFRIERLEDRIAPSLVLGGIFYDSVPSTGEVVGLDATRIRQSHALDPFAAVCAFIGMPAGLSFTSRTPVAESSAAVMANSESSSGSHTAPQNPAMPNWAAELLHEIQRKLDQAAATAGCGTAEIHAHSSAVVGRIEQDDEISSHLRNLQSRVVADHATDMPPWAEQLLGDIQTKFEKFEVARPSVVGAT